MSKGGLEFDQNGNMLISIPNELAKNKELLEASKNLLLAKDNAQNYIDSDSGIKAKDIGLFSFGNSVLERESIKRYLDNRGLVDNEEDLDDIHPWDLDVVRTTNEDDPWVTNRKNAKAAEKVIEEKRIKEKRAAEAIKIAEKQKKELESAKIRAQEKRNKASVHTKKALMAEIELVSTKSQSKKDKLNKTIEIETKKASDKG